MGVTVEELAEKLEGLESDVAFLKALVNEPTDLETAAERGARSLAQSDRDEPALRALAPRILQEMGIKEEPVPIEELRRIFQECGVKPEDRLLSRGVVEMREE
jgi:hypothetical protein